MKERKRQIMAPACMPILKSSMKKHWSILGGFVIAITGSVLLKNVLIIQLINEITTALAEGKRQELLISVVFFLGFYVSVAFLKRGSALLKVYFGRNVSMDVEQDLIKRYSRIRYRDYYFETDHVLGQIRGNGISAVTSWCDFWLGMISSIITFLISSMYLSSINILAVVLCIILTGIFLLITHQDNQRLPMVLQQFNGYMATLYAKQWEQVSNHKIASYLNQEKVVASFRRTVDSFMADLRKIKRIANRSSLFATFGTDLIVLGAVLLSTLLFSRGHMELGGILAMIICIPNVSSTLFSIPQMRNSYEQSMGGMRMMDEIYRMAEENHVPVEIKQEKVDEIHIEELSFHYRNQDKQVLDGLNMKFGYGIHLLQGPSGCGKSTLIRILAGELPLQDGILKLGTQEIKDGIDYDFSKYVEYMAQIPVVMKATVRDNILMGKSMERERFEQAVKNAGLNGLLQTLPEGELTMVSVDTLSSGEKQKIAIARMFYQNKPVWILDEPTSALDPASIEVVLKGMAEYARERIILLSSHQSVKGVEMKIHSFENTECEEVLS